MQNEIWKDIVGYEGLYQISNLGNVKSFQSNSERILKSPPDKHGYRIVILCKKQSRKSFKVHQLVAMAFLNHLPNGNKMVVDHINDDKSDNRLENLQVVSHRFNSRKTQGRYSSNYKGVSLIKSSGKWAALIQVSGRLKYLGSFLNEYDAHVAYQTALNNLK